MKQADCKQVSTSAAEATLCFGQRSLPVFPSECCPQERIWWELLGYNGNPTKSRRCKAVRGTSCGEKPVGGSQCSIILLLFAFYLHLHQMFTLKGIPSSILMKRTSFYTWHLGVLHPFLFVSSPFVLILAKMQMIQCNMRSAFGLGWMQQKITPEDECIRETDFKSKFPLQYNYSYFNKGLQHFYSATPLYKERVVPSWHRFFCTSQKMTLLKPNISPSKCLKSMTILYSMESLLSKKYHNETALFSFPLLLLLLPHECSREKQLHLL